MTKKSKSSRTPGSSARSSGKFILKRNVPREDESGRLHTASQHSMGGRWLLRDAKGRFSELVRRVKSEGPQIVTVHGREEVVVVAADEYRRLKGETTGQALIDTLQASPHREEDIAPPRGKAPVRDVTV